VEKRLHKGLIRVFLGEFGSFGMNYFSYTISFNLF
jgi:hypothetical protein